MRTALIIICIFALAATAARAASELTTVGAVRALTLEEAGKHLPVRIRGVITYCDQREARGFVQDESGGVFFRPPRQQPGEPEISAGDSVEISGVTWRGRFSPSVSGDPADASLAPLRDEVKPVRVTKLGRGELPGPSPASLDRIRIGEFHNQFVKVRATIQRVGLQKVADWSGLRLELSTRDGLLVALIRRDPRDEGVPLDWAGNEADIRAVVAGSGDEHGQFSEPWLAVDATGQVAPDFAGTQQALAQPARSFRELFRYAPPGQTPGRERVHVAGTVTLVRPGAGYFLGSEAGGIWVEALHFPAVQIGDVLDVAAYPARHEKLSFLQDEISRVRRRGEPLAPRTATPEEAARRLHEAALIAVDGQLLDELATPEQRVLFLEAAGRRFSARLPIEPGATPLPKLEPGSWLRVTGVCEMGTEAALGGEPRPTFSLLLRSAEDVAVLRTPPWLTPQRLTALLAAVGAGLLLCAAWIALLRRQVARQTRTIAREIGQRTTIEERHRIARELHDSLEQELAGVNLHLDTAADCAADLPPRVAHAIVRARAMLQHSRAEARRSILDLRSQTIEQLGLVGSLRALAEIPSGLDQAPIVVHVEGPERRLPQHVEFQLLRIAQEAAANALKHARATRITITLDFGERGVHLLIADDGAGFDAAHADNTRFGLRGMRERAAKISAAFQISSAVGQGTRVSVTLPSSAETGGRAALEDVVAAR